MEEEIASFYGKDHDQLDGYFRKFQELKKKDYAQAKEFFKKFKFGLQRHIVWEEEILFPIFEERTGMQGGPTAVMRMEHIQIKKLLSSIYDQILKRNFETESLESQLFGILSSHNVKEENVLYPWIDQTLSLEEIKVTFQKLN